MNTCERCGATGEVIKEGPFAGSTQPLDYCEYCSANLCDNCMKEGHCNDSPTNKHKPAEIEELE